jgi:mycoredoxin
VESSADVILYSTTWCGYCRALKRDLAAASISYVEIDIEEHPEAGAMLESLTGGYRTVPTVKVCDEYLVNPSVDEIATALRNCRSYSS